MVQDVLSIRTDEALRKKIAEAAAHKLSANELLEQRVSFVYSSLGHQSNVTREQVRSMLIREGGEAVTEK